MSMAQLLKSDQKGSCLVATSGDQKWVANDFGVVGSRWLFFFPKGESQWTIGKQFSTLLEKYYCTGSGWCFGWLSRSWWRAFLDADWMKLLLRLLKSIMCRWIHNVCIFLCVFRNLKNGKKIVFCQRIPKSCAGILAQQRACRLINFVARRCKRSQTFLNGANSKPFLSSCTISNRIGRKGIRVIFRGYLTYGGDERLKE